ncbi:uncharacterized protein LOC124285994 [Haliotis rubra]|uniref:uncharacterized protein LOC124285994 n=1 Tax=Haliotis rubra TaxID=36100 RepID=UPI001EE59724|nr:uncharacterized protein LOC124285994 [Haliotis rubra]
MKTLELLVAVSLFHTISEDFFPQLYTIGTHYQIGHTVYYSGFLDTMKKYYSGYLDTVKKVFPDYVSELTGLADGAGVSFTQAFSLMISPEIKAVLDMEAAQACSDVYVVDQQIALGHNEDSPEPALIGRVFMVHATIVDHSGSVLEKFSSLNIPARYFINRAVLGVTSQRDLENLLQGLGVGAAYGFK